VAVSVTPAQIVPVLAVRRYQVVEQPLQVRDAPGSYSSVVRPLVDDGAKITAIPFVNRSVQPPG